jgi:aminopeptidase YwaD
VGSRGNQDAAAYIAEAFRSLGYRVGTPEFTCLDWEHEGAECRAGGESFAVEPSPYSLGCDVAGPLLPVGNRSELASTRCGGGILLLHGDLAREQLMPKNFPFYNPAEHREIIRLLEEIRPAALICATTRNPELAGAIYPFPLFEDGDFDIPSVFTTDEVGRGLKANAGRVTRLISRARRIASTGCNVVAALDAAAQEKIVVCAHFDAKIGTPGALDNAAGVVTLLCLAEMLESSGLGAGVELLAVNGEDYYGANGERNYLEHNQGELDRILLSVNMDALGFVDGKTAYSLYEVPGPIADAVRAEFSGFPGMVEGESWYQSDHMVFVMNGLPAVAITSDRFMEIETRFAHTAADTPELVDLDALVEAARAVSALTARLRGRSRPMA